MADRLGISAEIIAGFAVRIVFMRNGQRRRSRRRRIIYSLLFSMFHQRSGSFFHKTKGVCVMMNEATENANCKPQFKYLASIIRRQGGVFLEGWPVESLGR